MKIRHSKSFETQKVREIRRKDTEESKGFPILLMGIIEEIFQIEERKESLEWSENVKKKIHAKARKVF